MRVAVLRAGLSALPASLPSVSSAVVPLWAVASSALTPAVLTAAWVIADSLQPSSYSPMRQTVSSLAGQSAADRWILTTALYVAGVSYFATAAGLAGVRWPGRILLVVAGLCSIGIATSPEHTAGPTAAHLVWTVTGAVTITIWPAVASWQAPTRPEVMNIRGALPVTVAFAVMLAGVVVETRVGAELGLAERVTSSLQTAWPFVLAVAMRKEARQSFGGFVC